ncbi:hypothetical protein QEG98_28405 [Myxococcus sp. MxC21-1]|uniref:hypothetical protein n=1 Tax=Myxococcus sp. MxC21-1 TaxID=3041439 RepID=UPI00292E7740|nr:hypothetical protein [Myxococcus sp. MxC21-1]WNZ59929.1 hypothetical protein QEG98_28405 [Myxococcus sp. MxC21-1]
MAPPPARKRAEPVTPSPDKLFFAWTQEERSIRFPGAIPERPPANWATWYAEALTAVGGDEERLRGAWLAWLEDAWAHRCKPVCAVVGFTGAREGSGTGAGTSPASSTARRLRRRRPRRHGAGRAPTWDEGRRRPRSMCRTRPQASRGAVSWGQCARLAGLPPTPQGNSKVASAPSSWPGAVSCWRRRTSSP